MVTGGAITKHSRLCEVIGPRNRNRSSRSTGVMESHIERSDMIDFAVRKARNLIASNTTSIRDGRDYTVENDLSAESKTNDRSKKLQGWASKPLRGKQYGKRYIGIYRDDIREMFQ